MIRAAVPYRNGGFFVEEICKKTVERLLFKTNH